LLQGIGILLVELFFSLSADGTHGGKFAGFGGGVGEGVAFGAGGGSYCFEGDFRVLLDERFARGDLGPDGVEVDESAFEDGLGDLFEGLVGLAV